MASEGHEITSETLFDDSTTAQELQHRYKMDP